jgi:hypothetical protein
LSSSIFTIYFIFHKIVEEVDIFEDYRTSEKNDIKASELFPIIQLNQDNTSQFTSSSSVIHEHNNEVSSRSEKNSVKKSDNRTLPLQQNGFNQTQKPIEEITIDDDFNKEELKIWNEKEKK